MDGCLLGLGIFNPNFCDGVPLLHHSKRGLLYIYNKECGTSDYYDAKLFGARTGAIGNVFKTGKCYSKCYEIAIHQL